MMQVIDFPQGSPEWLAHRRNHFNASDAPAMMGCSPYKSRQELIKELATGVTPDVDARTQARFDEGHRIEALARPLAEKILSESLYPITGSNGRLSASFDGLTMDWSVAFEHKTLNDELRAAIQADAPAAGLAKLPLLYRVQMQQQLDVSGADRVLFGATTWNGNECTEQRWSWYVSDPELSEQIKAGWEQLEKDVAAYRPEPVPEVVTAAPIEALPAVVVNVGGELSIMSNLDLFGGKLKEFVSKIVMKPSTDQEFADAEQAVKALQKAQDALEAAQANALAQISDVEKLTRLVSDLSTLARTTRLALSKSVESRKEQIKLEIVQEGKDALAAHIASINAGLPRPYMPPVAADFGAAIKGKRTVATLREAMLDCLAKAKIESDAIGKRITANLAILTEFGSEHKQLFPDTGAIVLKQTEDVTALVKSRIAEFKEAEEKRKAEEQARAETKQKAEAEEAERKRVADEAEKAVQPVVTVELGGLGHYPLTQPTESKPDAELAKPNPTNTSISSATKPIVGGSVAQKSEFERPTDAAIIQVVANAFVVSPEMARQWIKEIS